MTHFKPNRCLLAFASLVFFGLPAYADLITFTSRPTFNAAAPGLPTETFESGLVNPGALTLCTGPLSSAAGSTCFPVGGLLPGVTYNASAQAAGNLIILGANYPGVGNTSKALGPNLFAETFNLTFTAANAIGFDVFPGPAAGNVVISVFDTANTSLGVFTVSAPLGATFFGVVNTTGAIGRINVASQSASAGELIDNLTFGTAAVNPIPEPATLFMLGTGLAGIDAAIRRYRTSKEK